MAWNENVLSGSKRASDQQLPQSFTSSSKKQCFWPCPKCNRSFASYTLDEHINQCAQSSYSVSSESHVESSTEPAGSISPPPTGPISVDRFSVLQRVADERPLASEIINAEDMVALGNPVTSHDLMCESNRSIPSDPGRCSADSQLNYDVQSEDGFFCTQAQDLYSGLCTNRLCGSENAEESSVDDGRALDYAYVKGEMLQNFDEPVRPDMRKIGCQEITEGPVEADSSLDEVLKDGIGRVVERPPAGFKLYQRQRQSQAKLAMFFKQPSFAAVERRPSVSVLQPGMILFKNWLDLEKQQQLVQESQNVAHLFHRPVTSGGGKYHIYSMCWGPKWNPKTHRYAGTGAERPLPDWMFDLAQGISREAQRHSSVYPSDLEFAPDVALVNFYPVKAEELGVVGLGGHQDLDDSCTMPVVSVSIGDSMTFFYRRLPPLSRRKSMIYVSVDENAARRCEDGDAAHNGEKQIILKSGDVLVFGGKSRLIYHGTRHVQAGTRPPGLHMVPGRLNFTFRQTDAALKAQKSTSHYS